MSWDADTDIKRQRAEERERRRWWAENYPPERGGRRPGRCGSAWLGPSPGFMRDDSHGEGHACARPVEHPPPCFCRCSERWIGQGKLF
jgi:hypothetical protein